MPDLQIDLAMLGGSVSSLGALLDAFNNSQSIASDGHEAIGASEMCGALDNFATNWKIHREKLTSSIQAVHDMAKQSHDTYVSADDHLAQQATGMVAQPVIHRGGPQ